MVYSSRGNRNAMCTVMGKRNATLEYFVVRREGGGGEIWIGCPLKVVWF